MLMRIVLSVCCTLLVACGPALGGAPEGPGAGEVVSSDSNGNCNPTADQAAFFVDADYKGQCVVLSAGDFADVVETGLPDNSISSVRVGSNARTTLCLDKDFGGSCENVQANDNSLANNPDVGDNQTSSVRVRTG